MKMIKQMKASSPAIVTSPLSLMLTMWFLQMDWVSLELGSVTRGRMPLHAANTSPRRTADTKMSHHVMFIKEGAKEENIELTTLYSTVGQE